MRMNIRRAVAYLIDIILNGGLMWLYSFFAMSFFQVKNQTYGMFMVLCAFIISLFLTVYYPTKTNGQTVGDKIMKIQVINKSGKNRTYFQSFLRELVLKYAFCSFFILIMLIYKVVDLIIHRTLDSEWPHDVLLGTEVIKKEN